MNDEHDKYPDYDPKKRNRFLTEFNDRGMVKWGGFYLSDHTRVIEKNELRRFQIEHRKKETKMSTADISTILFSAFVDHKEVIVQIDQENRDHKLPEIISGYVGGYDEDKIIIGEFYIDYRLIQNCSIK